MDRSPRYNGAYSDYMRDFSHRPPPPHPMAQFGPPPNFYDQSSYGPQYERPPRGYPMPHSDYPVAQHSSDASNKRYERDVDDFLRRTSESAKPRARDDSYSRRGGERDRDREREREREYHQAIPHMMSSGGDRGRDRDRGRERERERDHRDTDRDYKRREMERERGTRQARDRR